MVSGQNLGSAVTLGSGVPLHVMYELTRAQGKITVGGTASTIVPSGGYVQGGGHSPLSPTFGLLADNCLGICPLLLTLCLFHQRSFSELSVVIADGSLVTANSVENSDRMYNFLYCTIE
jgi:FAD/FMN-containing dehydrogenase